MTKNNKKMIIGITLVVFVLLFIPAKNYLTDMYWYYNNNGETGGNQPPQGPSEAEQKEIDEYYKKCPLDKLSFEYRGSDFKITSARCSENEQFKDTVSKGEDGKVEIYTQDFEEGKQLFRDWLSSKGLSESLKLRITYTHKPQ